MIKVIKAKLKFYKINFVSYSLTRLNIKNVKHNKLIIIILSYYNINI